MTRNESSHVKVNIQVDQGVVLVATNNTHNNKKPHADMHKHKHNKKQHAEPNTDSNGTPIHTTPMDPTMIRDMAPLLEDRREADMAVVLVGKVTTKATHGSDKVLVVSTHSTNGVGVDLKAGAKEAPGIMSPTIKVLAQVQIQMRGFM
eukprot:TRINITY_DN63675_c0_g1_i1.p3 TRINITY_DN63675_c0_g1~~TRINITY_DN63675_c0_g1_i1.p3  ORF type:complete len:148 (+),score=30.55 TRINITY_DN63675_c0_g1_i1:310-753(+)